MAVASWGFAGADFFAVAMMGFLVGSVDEESNQNNDGNGYTEKKQKE